MPRWLLYTLLAVICWGVWALLGKVIGDALSPALTQALSTIGLLPIMLVLWRFQKSSKEAHQRGSSTKGKLFALGAGVITCLGNISYYDVLNRGAKASMVVPLTALYPLVTVLLALVVLKEHLNLIQGLGIALSLVAIYLFNVQQEEGFLSVWLLLALIPIALWGIAGLLQKLATNHISGESATLWFLLAFVPVATGILVLAHWPALVSGRTWLLVAALGFTFALGNLGLLAAFASNGKASIIAPLAGLYPLVSIPIAIIALHERIGFREGTGIVLALISVIALSRETPVEEKRVVSSNIQQPTAK
jgi:uncharacterized membrane protein